MLIRTRQQLDELIASFDSTPADLERIAANPVASVEFLARLFEGIESQAEVDALVRANPRYARELAEAQGAYDSMCDWANRCERITSAPEGERAALIAKLTKSERALFVAIESAHPADASVEDHAAAYLAMVVDEI